MALVAVHDNREFHVGDIVRVYQKIQEDNKTRTQVFEGMVIAIRGEGVNKTFTVHRVGVGGIAVERIFPLFSPFIEKVEVKTLGHVRRSKLYYIREKTSREVAEITKPRNLHQPSSKSKKPVRSKTKKLSRAKK